MNEALQSGTVLLHDPTAGRWLLFERPLRVHAAWSADAVLALLQQVQQEVDDQNLFAAGFLAYEAAAAFDPAFRTQTMTGFPLGWFGIYAVAREVPCPHLPHAVPSVIAWKMSLSRQDYESVIDRIRDYIHAGDTYQVNYTVRLSAPFSGDPWNLFAQMVEAQGPHYAAFLNTDDWSVCCASPELFFRLDGQDIACRPMKGTAARGLWPAQDRQRAIQLQYSGKDRAENVMVLDMVRNDLGRVAHTGSVIVHDAFQIEKYPTLWQMTSTVRAKTGAPASEIFRALFPAASITGAPKIRTMEIIADLEKSPRGIYTGAIGFIAPNRQAQFNVAIRTVLVDKKQGRAEYGVGGGIVWDSVPAQEFAECRTKARIITHPLPPFELIETLLWTPAEGYHLIEAHLRRLAGSADYFTFALDIERVRRELTANETLFSRSLQRVRVSLSRNGKVVLKAEPLAPVSDPCRVGLAAAPIDSTDVFLYHKTTRREVYERARARHSGWDDVLLWNEHEELTESSIANLVVEKGGRLLTPPVECGLLPGVYRATLLETGEVQEERIRIQDLPACTKLYLANSVRGMWEIRWKTID